MNAEQIYKTALEELANQGNQVAMTALSIGTKAEAQQPAVYTNQVISELKEASSQLNEALRTNNDSWSSSTDGYIKRAQTRILNAVALL